MNRLLEVLTERPESWLPEDVRVIALVRAADAGWAAGAAAEIADRIGRHRPRTVLIDAIPSGSGLDILLGAAGGPGLAAVLRRERTVADVAITPGGRSFTFLPAGSPGLSFRKLQEHPGFRYILHRVRRGKGTLLLFAADGDVTDAFSEATARSEIDGCVCFGSVRDDIAAVIGAPVLARVDGPPGPPERPEGPLAEGKVTPPEPTASVLVAGRAADASADTSTVSRFARALRRGGKQRTGRWRTFRAVLIVWAVAVAAVFLFVPEKEGLKLPGWPVPMGGDEEPPPPSVVEESTDAEAGLGREPSAEQMAGEAEPVASQPVERAAPEPEPATFVGGELPYSILVASYITWQDAAARRDRLERDGGLYLVAPTPIRGRTYYRLFAGALPDRLVSESRMRELVASGVKERERAWDIRPARLSFALGTFRSLREAEALRDRLHEGRLPGYVLEGGRDEEQAYRVYSGAYESESAAAVLDSLLGAAGFERELEVRRGSTR